MLALDFLLAAALALLALGPVGRVLPRRVPVAMAAVCLLGLAGAVAALMGGPVETLDLGLVFAVDGFSGAVLAALFLYALAGTAFQRRGGRVPVVAGAVCLAVLAADGGGLLIAIAAAAFASRTLTEPAVPSRGVLNALLAWPKGWWPGAGAVAALAVAVLLLGGLDPRFAAMRAMPPEGLRAVLIPLAAVVAAALLPRALPPGLGGLAAFYALGRLLLDLSGPVTPGWWGVPVLVLGAALAVLGAERAAAADELGDAGSDAATVTLGMGMMGLGAALLARGADLPPLAALAVAGALLQVLAWSVWGGLLALGAGAVREGAGTAGLARLGGLMRRMPATGLALLVALASMAAVPLSAGFAGVWTVAQALLGVGRLGGIGPLLMVAGAAAALGFAVALMAASAVRLVGVVLLGAPRTAKAAAAAEPRLVVRLGMAVLAGAALLLGVCPGLGLSLAQPGARLLAGGAAPGAGWLVVGNAADGPGYAAPVLALVVVAVLAIVGFAGRAGTAIAPPWQGGFAEDGIGRGNIWPLMLRVPLPGRVGWGRAGLVILGLALAAALGWAAR